MKISKASYVLVIGTLLFASMASAMKLAPFPNSKPLQPIPANVQPNITNNINSNPTPTPVTQVNLQDNPSAASPTPETTTQESNTVTYIVYAIVGLAIAGVIFLKVRSKLKK